MATGQSLDSSQQYQSYTHGTDHEKKFYKSSRVDPYQLHESGGITLTKQ